MNSPYSHLVRFHSRNVYKRGANKGDAPLERSGATHKRVLNPSAAEVRVRMHHSDILVAYVDGTIKLDTNDWHSAKTTRRALHEALYAAGVYGCWVYSKRVGGYSQTAITTRHGTWRFYDGMRFDGDGRLLSEVRPWTAKVANRSARKARLAELKPLLDMLPVLYFGLGNMDPSERPYPQHVSQFKADCPEMWPAIVLKYSWGSDGDWKVCAKNLKEAAVCGLVMYVDRDEA